MPTTCIVCFVDCEQAVSCSNAHSLCYSCCEQLVRTAAEKLAQTNHLEATSREADEETRLELGGRIRCPCAKAGGRGSAPYTDAALARAISEDSFAQYIQARTLLPIAERRAKHMRTHRAPLGRNSACGVRVLA